jgi:hypothetical protein
LGLRTWSTTAPGYIGISLYKSGGSALVGSSVGPVAVCTGGGATGAATVAGLHAAKATRQVAAKAASLNRLGWFCVLLVSESRFLKSVNRPKKQ